MAHEFHEFTRNMLNYINGDLIGRTNLTNNKSFVFMQRLCLEGTTERSDSNRVRSARIDGTRTMCLEGTTPQDMQFVHRKRRTAFQAELLQQFLPRTSSPVTIATLSSAFQALNA